MTPEIKTYLLLKYGTEAKIYDAYCNQQLSDIGREEYKLLGEYFDEYLRLNPAIRVQKISL